MGTIETSIDAVLDLTISTAKGKIAAEDIINWITSYYSGVPTKLSLWDFLEADLSEISSEETRIIVETVKEKAALRAGGKTALVVNEDLGYGLSRMYGTLSEILDVQIQYRSFKGIEEFN